MKNLLVLFFMSLIIQGLNAQGPIGVDFFKEVDSFLKNNVSADAVDYARIQKQPEVLNDLLQKVAKADLNQASAETIQAFYINAYNLLVIDGVIKNYPLNSVLNVSGFFDTKRYQVAGKSITLNQLEKDNLLKTYKDPRFHFVLVCGAVDCPPITNFAYTPDELDRQLEDRTRKALNDPNFIKVDKEGNRASISQIFDWYSADFGGNKKTARTFINNYREEAIPESYSIVFYNYDWALNEKANSTGAALPQQGPGNSSARYVVSAAIPKGTTETKIFNNLYTQESGNGSELIDRSTFFTSWVSFVYGVNNRFNAGFDIRYRRVFNDRLPSSPLNVFGGGDEGSARSGITTFGPKIRWAPFEALPNFSVQSAFWFPIGEELEGNSNQPFIDWNGATWWTQFFNDFTLNSNFSLFTEIDFLWEDIGRNENGALNRVSTPATVIFSYFPNPKTTLYALTNFSPFWQEDFDYFAQAGLGAKYQFTPKFEIELLYTAFTNEFLQDINGRAATYNIGIRFNR